MSTEKKASPSEDRQSHRTDPLTFEVRWEDIEYIEELSRTEEYPDDWSLALGEILEEHREKI